MFYLRCFARVCKVVTALVLTATTYVCSVFGLQEIVYLGCYCWAQRREKRCKVEVGHVFFQKFNRDVFVCFPCRNYNSVPASQACITQLRVVQRFCAESKNKRSHRGTLAVRICKFLSTVLSEQGFPTLCFPCTLKHSDTWACTPSEFRQMNNEHVPLKSRMTKYFIMVIHRYI